MEIVNIILILIALKSELILTQYVKKNCDTRIDELHVKLNQTQMHISQLSIAVAMLVSESTDDLRNRLTSLEVLFKKQQKNINDISKRGENTSTGEIMNFSDQLSEQVRSIEVVVAKKIAEVRASRYPTEIVEQIKSHEFQDAERKLLHFSNKGTTQLIVHEVYSNNIGNFGLILEFAKQLTSKDIAQYVLIGLWNELKTNGHRDPYKLIDFIKVFNDRVINNENVNEQEKNNCIQIRSQAMNTLKTVCAEKLRSALQFEKCNSHDENIKLSIELNAFDKGMHEEVTHLTIDHFYPQMARKDLLIMIYNSKYLLNKIDALIYIYNKIKVNDDRNDIAMFTLSEYLTILRNDRQITGSQRSLLYNTIHDFPESLRTLHLAAKSICFKNAQYPEYMYTGEPKYDNDRRRILTWTPGDKDHTGVWISEKPKNSKPHEFAFRNLAHYPEYLFAAGINLNPENRFFFVWIPAGSTNGDDKAKMELELHGDAVAMKTTYFKHYMCVSTLMFEDLKRHVLSSNNGNSSSPSCQWILEDCSNI